MTIEEEFEFDLVGFGDPSQIEALIPFEQERPEGDEAVNGRLI